MGERGSFIESGIICHNGKKVVAKKFREELLFVFRGLIEGSISDFGCLAVFFALPSSLRKRNEGDLIWSLLQFEGVDNFSLALEEFGNDSRIIKKGNVSFPQEVFFKIEEGVRSLFKDFTKIGFVLFLIKKSPSLSCRFLEFRFLKEETTDALRFLSGEKQYIREDFERLLEECTDL